MRLYDWIRQQTAVRNTTSPWQETNGKQVAAAGEIRVYRGTDGGWIFRLKRDDCPLWVETDAEYRKIELCIPPGVSPDVEAMDSRFLLRTAFECCFCHEGIVSLHGASVEVNGFAVVFTGRSRLGKSTRAKAWTEALCADWISGDRPAIRLTAQGAAACGVPWDGKEQIFRSVEEPLLCIMEVRRSPVNYLRRLSEDQACRLLMQQSFIPMWDTDAAVMAMINVRRLVRNVPVYRVFCGPEHADAVAIHDILVRRPELIRKEAKDMQIKKDFVLRNVVDEFIVMPTGDNITRFEGAVVLNDVGAFIYTQLMNPVSRDDVLAAVLAEYDVDEATAAADLDELLQKLNDLGVLDNP